MTTPPPPPPPPPLPPPPLPPLPPPLQTQERWTSKHRSTSINNTAKESRHNNAMNNSEAAAVSVAPGVTALTTLTESTSTSTTTTRPPDAELRETGTIPEAISSSPPPLPSPPVETSSTINPQQDIVSAQLVENEEDEAQRHAEFLFQQMLAQATVAECVDEQEMRLRAREQAALELEQQQQEPHLLDEDQEETVTSQDHKNIKWQQQRRRIIIAGFFIMTVIAVVVLAVVFLGLGGSIDRQQQQQQQQQGRGDTAAHPQASMPTNSIAPTVSFSPSTTPSLSLPPSTIPSSMPSAATSWQQIGNSINGTQENDQFGYQVGISLDGNTVVATTEGYGYGADGVYHGDRQIVWVYSYHNETGKWKQLGQNIPDWNLLSLSPNGKFLAVISYWGMRIFALRDNNNNNGTAMTAAEDDTTAAMFWEQIGPDIITPNHATGIMSETLTDNLELAVLYNTAPAGGLVYVYQFDANQSAWVQIGQKIKMYVYSMQLVNHKSTGMLWLALGAAQVAHVFRYEPDTDSWIQIGSELAADDEMEMETIGLGVAICISMDGETITVGAWNDADGQAIGILRSFSYDAATDNWIQLGKDLKDSSFLFRQFSLSGNGKVLVATTLQSPFVTGHIHTWDFIATGGGGEWIQREAALQVGTLESSFGYSIALSGDGSHLVTGAISALNKGIESGKVRVFEQY